MQNTILPYESIYINLVEEKNLSRAGAQYMHFGSLNSEPVCNHCQKKRPSFKWKPDFNKTGHYLEIYKLKDYFHLYKNGG